MRKRHPLENPSLTPYGFVFPSWQERLKHKQPPNMTWLNEENIMGRIWDRANRANAPKPLPAETILHDILPSLKTANRLASGDFMFNGLPYLTRDILVLSSFMQWFGTGVGRCFLESAVPSWDVPANGYIGEWEFLIKLKIEQQRWEPIANVVHVCTDDCDKIRSLNGSCHRSSAQIMPRDRAVVEGLLRWLGKQAGRAFIAEFQRRKKNAWNAARSRQKAEWKVQSLVV
ncbi:MAG: hypothetical protein PHD04_03135 [Candidatus Pacebacteria bacterium]|nr:hypothetical protein [Candidatus Paceibacterota bacterium]